MSRNLIIGSSHSLRLADNVGEFTATWQEASRDLVRIVSPAPSENWLLFSTHRPDFIEFREDPAGLKAVLRSPIEKVRTFNTPDSKVIFAIGGNEHNIRFLKARPDPFDFVHPSVPATDPSRQILPLRDMTDVLRTAMTPAMTVTRILAGQLSRAQGYCLAPPPPIPSEAQIRGQPEVFDFNACGVEAASVRLKIYNLYVEVLEAFAREIGLTFLPPRSEARDEAGFLKEEFWAGSTHAAAPYYAPYVAELGLRD
jgi:hypothetical protein